MSTIIYKEENWEEFFEAIKNNKSIAAINAWTIDNHGEPPDYDEMIKFAEENAEAFSKLMNETIEEIINKGENGDVS